VCEAPVLAIPNPGQPFRLHTDASAISVGCQLSQCDNTGQEHPIALHVRSSPQPRWALALQEYDITFEYTKGTNNVVADCLSQLEPE